MDFPEILNDPKPNFSKEKLYAQSLHLINGIHILLHYTDA